MLTWSADPFGALADPFSAFDDGTMAATDHGQKSGLFAIGM